MHQAQWSPERPLPPPVSLDSQSHHEKPPEVTCTSRGNPGFPASTRESPRSEEHTSELQSPTNLVCRLLLEKKNTSPMQTTQTPHNPGHNNNQQKHPTT